MKIAAIRTYLLQTPLEQPFGFSQWYYSQRANLLVAVETDEGCVGWGECYGPGPVTQSAIETLYAPLLIGRDPLKNEAAWQHCWRAALDFSRKGILMGALSGIDMALMDLKGKATGLSVSELMGGRLRDTVPCYATGMYFSNKSEDELLSDILEEAATHVASGFSALKIKVGKNLAFDKRQIRAMRSAFPDTCLMADSNHAFDFPEAVQVGRVLEECDYAWFEEPLSPQHPELFRRLADKLDVPLATGECEQTRWGFEQLMSAGGVHILQPDLAYCGGPSEALKIRAIASAKGINVVPHAWGTLLNLAAATHFTASTYVEPGRLESASPLLETDRTPNPMRDEMFATSLEFKDGHVVVPVAPGLGVEPDLSAMKRFLVKETQTDSPS
jgi:D-galactarolactone cycloisomerase